ncbi:coagulation factor V [Scomber scombrus]|uniref:coagulation factor V n=1 Tax=Scomber scombrus TaxID=13677 RepID=UPI002DDACC85|nr:coagulation factor V [Scomber scombrus]
MRLCAWAGVWSLLLILVLLNAFHVDAEKLQPKERHYYIAAVEIDWNYYGNDTHRSGPTYKKVVFREYEKGFRQAKTHPSWLGLLGPTLRAEEGETIVVTFRNMANGPYSMHPHGIAYGKQSEGAYYFDNTSQKEKQDDLVQPNCEHVYYWEVTSDVSPQPSDPNCLTYTYVSHQNVVQDYNSGLIGALLLCKPGSLNELGEQAHVNQELVFLFGVFDEKASNNEPSGRALENPVKFTINGYAKGSLPDVSVCAHSSVSLHLVGMSSEPEVFSVHLNGHVLQQMGHKVSSVGLISGSSTTASMVPVYTGRWLLSSRVIKHIEAGMHCFVDVKNCDAFQAPPRRLTIAQRRESRVWTYYIAAEEILWDYAPSMHGHIDADYKFQYLKQSPTRIGGKYKKAVYTLYTNESFTERSETRQRRDELGILGPVIRAQIRDVIRVVFKNKASRPYSIYPHGMTIEKSEEGVNYPEGGNQSHGVRPGETHTYEWRVGDEDEPLDGDSRCLTRMYHSAVDTPRDIASGLIGPILICKSQSLNVRNVQLRADKEQHAMFAVFDENKSWYLDDNIRQFCDRSKVNKADPDFYKYNVMHTINGYAFESGPVLGFCNGEVATWHVSSIGAQDYIQTSTFYGHPFELNGRTEDFLSLYPMTGETITMNMLNTGYWLLASLNSHETTKGMRVKFRDVECFRDYVYEYSEYEREELIGHKEFTVWKPPSLDDIKEQEEKEKPVEKKAVVVDDYTDIFADQLGLRSRKNQSSSSGAEMLDLSFLDYDAVDVLDGDKNSTLNFNSTTTETKSKNETFILKPNPLNGTLFSNLKELDIVNHTAVNLLNQSNENTTSFSDNSSVSNIEDTVNYSPNVTQNKNITQVVSSLNNVRASETENSTIHNDKTSIMVGNVSTETTNLNVTLPGNLSPILETERMNNTLSGDNQTAVNTTSLEESEKTLRGDVFSYSVPLPPSSINNLNSTTEDNVTSLSSSTNSSPENGKLNLNKTVHLKNVTMKASKSNPSGGIIFESWENVTALLDQLNLTSSVESFSNETMVSGNLSSHLVHESSSEEPSASDSSEEVFIYLRENNTEVITTTSIKTKGNNWSYEGTHQTVPMEIPDHMLKYLGKEAPAPKPKPKTIKVNSRQRPKKGRGMKTRKRKEYKPQARSGLPFSPRGFNPAMTPRGARPSSLQPFSDEEDLINIAVVIGVPRPDFSDYELYAPGSEPQHLDLDEQDVNANEYEYVSYKDPYSSGEDIKDLSLDDTTKYYLKNYLDPNVQTYFIAAEEVEWDYAGYAKRVDKLDQNSRQTKFTKAIFRSYMDGNFRTPDIRGEMDEHLGILGPVIKVDVGQTIMVVFRNNANRPYSLHPNGVGYNKKTEGLSYDDNCTYWFKYDNEVQPNTTYTYLWKANANVGPTEDESQCRTWAYYSGVNPERDIHSGLIGPLLVCREGTLDKKVMNTREFTLLFMTFDESQSWYYERNRELIQRKSPRKILGLDFKENLKFHSINGIIFSLKGLRMYTEQLVAWHLINMGSPRDFQSVHFHGQTFLHKHTTSYRHAVYPLLPGSFATLEMYPSKPGLWQLETEVGFNQQKGMQTLFLVLDNDCFRPLGLQSGSVKDDHITAINTRGFWSPHLARLNNQGKYNAWSTEQNDSWIQVDFQRPVVISQVATQGAKQLFQSQFVSKYYISYSNDRRRWIFYKGDSRHFRKVFDGNREAYGTNKNIFFPPVIGRFIRLHPINWYNTATVRMEFYGCELDGCSVPLGMESNLIKDNRITASSTATSWYSGPWKPSLARLNRQGTINAWQAKYNNMNQWLQVELPQIKKITGIVTQGAKSLGREMYVTSYALMYSNDGVRWDHYTDDEDIVSRTFIGNTENHEHVKNYIHPPIFSRFIRILPRNWMGSITMRVELLGCDFE